jgi:glutamine amidotransferase
VRPAVAIVASGGANIASLEFALERLEVVASLIDDPRRLDDASHVILPGVGAARDAMARLERSGFAAALRAFARPVLGICLGMQLLYDASEEGATPCLGVLPGRVARIPARPGLPVPHMGWNRVQPLRDSPLLAGVRPGAHLYFVHSYAAAVGPQTVGSADYGGPFSAAVSAGNFHGTQFHPERSAGAGAAILRNFLELA